MPSHFKSEPGRRTRQRILDATLALYNERGEPQVSTSLIATELGISAGNLAVTLHRARNRLRNSLPMHWRPVAGRSRARPQA